MVDMTHTPRHAGPLPPGAALYAHWALRAARLRARVPARDAPDSSVERRGVATFCRWRADRRGTPDALSTSASNDVCAGVPILRLFNLSVGLDIACDVSPLRACTETPSPYRLSWHYARVDV